MEGSASGTTDGRPLRKALSARRPYEYKQIDASINAIRLLIIEAYHYPNYLICRLQHVTVAQKPKYEAFSYTWGDETACHMITVDGQDLTVGQYIRCLSLPPAPCRRESALS
jgi:hypothetical protein